LANIRKEVSFANKLAIFNAIRFQFF